MTKAIAPAHLQLSLGAQATAQLPSALPKELLTAASATPESVDAADGTATLQRPPARQGVRVRSALLAQTMRPAPLTLPDASDMALEQSSEGVHPLGQVSAELFATDFIDRGLQTLQTGSNVLALSDGQESKSAGSICLDHSHLNIYSTDYNYPESIERVDMFGMGYFRVKLDNTKPINPSIFGSPDKKFSSVMLLKGLCDHNEWEDVEGIDAGPVGCSGVQLTPDGVSSLLASVTLLLESKARFALHGDINSMDQIAEHQALGPKVQDAIILGVQRFNRAYGAPIAKVHVGDTGLVIAGEQSQPLSAAQTTRLEAMVNDYFSKDRTVTCAQYPCLKDKPPTPSAGH